jgi:hypothetical protein
MSAPPAIQDRNQVAVVVSQVLGVFLVMITLITQHGQLRSLQPTGTKNQAAAKEDKQGNKFARLWEDPLEDFPTFQVAAVSPSPSPTSTVSPSARPTPSALSTATTSPSPTSIPPTKAGQTQERDVSLPLGHSVSTHVVLWNIVDARPLPEAMEQRLRIRYALISAILAEGYLPLRQSVLSPLTYGDDDTSRIVIGRFETFRKREDPQKNTWQYVSVIWSPKQLDLKQIEKKNPKEFWFSPEEQDKIKKRICTQDVPDNKSFEGDFWVLHHGNSDDLANLSAAGGSPPPNTIFVRATVPLQCVSIPPPEDWKSLQRITTDDVLVERLVAELSLRIPALKDERKPLRIVLFTESDTTYSRAIKEEFAGQLAAKYKNVGLEVYSYLRALDGKPDEPQAPETTQTSKSQEPSSLLQRRAISESTFGTSQFDYLRRTALEIKRNRPEDVVAVGILGSYIYDKMLVLQAVRPALPAAVFFTTDLDALYFDRTVQPFTRNLIVGSADDIDANETDGAATGGWQLPLMRDSYQTVLVREVRRILRLQGISSSAHIFEIGAGKRVDLTGAGTACRPLWWLAQRWFNPVIFLAGLLNAFLILSAVTSSDKNSFPPGAMKKWAPWLIWPEAIVAGAFVLVLLWALAFSNSDFLWGEPSSLGISIWPSVMIRSLAFAVAICLLYLAASSFIDYERFHQQNLNDALPPGMHFKAFFDRRWLRVWIVIISSLYLLLSCVVFWIWQPTVPGRGGTALLIEKIVLALGVGLYIVHLVFCFVVHFNAWHLLHAIASHFDPRSPTGSRSSIDLQQMLTSLGTLTTVIGKTLLYPLTVLILIILSRLRIFDNWPMTPSLLITFLFGAIVLVTVSLFLWAEGAKLKRDVLAQTSLRPPDRSSLQAITSGVFSAWYKQPIFAAILSALAVFGSVGIALTRLFSDSF